MRTHLKCLAYCLESVLATVFVSFIVSILGRGESVSKDKELGTGQGWEMVRY